LTVAPGNAKAAAMAAVIAQETKSAMQSGRAREGRWVLTYDAAGTKRHDPLTGWIGGGDTSEQLRLAFPTLEAAQAYAATQGLDPEIRRGSGRTLKLQAYSDNFR
jgi:ETC complex I subunit conserved region